VVEAEGQVVSHVRVSADIAAAATTVYSLVSDVTRMGEWSTETTSCRWLGPPGPAVGATFRGSNRYGIVRWSTTCTVTAADPGRRFAFSVSRGTVLISEWCYQIEPAPGGCTVTESWVDKRPGWLRLTSPAVIGIVNRPAHNRAGMQATLAALKAAAEAAG
jgi:hypothetical protein